MTCRARTQDLRGIHLAGSQNTNPSKESDCVNKYAGSCRARFVIALSCLVSRWRSHCRVRQGECAVASWGDIDCQRQLESGGVCHGGPEAKHPVKLGTGLRVYDCIDQDANEIAVGQTPQLQGECDELLEASEFISSAMSNECTRIFTQSWLRCLTKEVQALT